MSGMLAAALPDCVVYRAWPGCGRRADLRAELDRDEAALTTLRNELIEGRLPDRRTVSTAWREPRRIPDWPACMPAPRKSSRWQNGGETRNRSLETDQERLREFLRRRDDALFQDTQLMDLDPTENVAVVRKSTVAALKLFAADRPAGDAMGTGPAP